MGMARRIQQSLKMDATAAAHANHPKHLKHRVNLEAEQIHAAGTSQPTSATSSSSSTGYYGSVTKPDFGISSLSLGTLAHHTLPDKIRTAARHGYSGIEIFIPDFEDFIRQCGLGMHPEVLKGHVHSHLHQEKEVDGVRVAYSAQSANIAQSFEQSCAAAISTLCRQNSLKIHCLQPLRDFENIGDCHVKLGYALKKAERYLQLMRSLDTDLLLICSNNLAPLDPLAAAGASYRKYRDAQVNALQALGRRAEQLHLRIGYEPLAWGTVVNSWSQVWDIVQRVDLASVGVVLDTFNSLASFYADPSSPTGVKEGMTVDMLYDYLGEIFDTIPPHKLFLLQIADAERAREGRMWHASRNAPARMKWSRSARLFPCEEGRGAYLPLEDFVRTIMHAGYVGPWSTEVYSSCLESDEVNAPSVLAKRGIDGLQKLYMRVARSIRGPADQQEPKRTKAWIGMLYMPTEEDAKPACGPCAKSRQKCIYPEPGSDDRDRHEQGIKRKNKVKDLEDKIQTLEKDVLKWSTVGVAGIAGIAGTAGSTSTANAYNHQLYDTSLGIPNWNPYYPPLDLTLHLLNTFFNACPIVAGFLHRPSFMQRAMLPCSHPDAPPSALMHAIFCSASRHSPRTTNPVAIPRHSECNPFTTFNPPSTFLEVHARLASDAIETETVSNSTLTQKAEALQALIIMSHFFHIEDRWADHYRINVMCIRGTVVLRLHLDMEMTPNRALLAPPRNDIERECRKFTFFLAYIFDTLYSSISSTYSSNIADDEILTKLPIKTSDYDNLSPSQSIPEYNQHIDDQDFFTEHEADGFHFVIKSSVLLARVNRFKHVCERDVLKQGLQSANQLGSFSELDRLILRYRTSVPDSWVDSVQIVDGGLDIGIYLAHLVGIKAMMSLHSGFIHDSFSRKRLMTCARIIMSTIYRLLGTSWDLCKLPSYVVSIYNDASDILIAAYLHAAKTRDNDAAQLVMSELATIAEVYRRMSERIPVALSALSKLHNKLDMNGIEKGMGGMGGVGSVSTAATTTSASHTVSSSASQPTSQFDHTHFNDALLEQLAFETIAPSPNAYSAFNHEYIAQNHFHDFGIAPGTAFTAKDEWRWMNMEGDIRDGDPFSSSFHSIDGFL
ncbi:hypothetical protein E3P91_00635 [Wallemia ichthyophaga]|nr:hypothetical protein E3P91_00635 [Wallemia ichthyophaga]